MSNQQVMAVSGSGQDDVVRAARSILLASPYQGIRQLECQFHDAELTVRGMVATFYLKQMALVSLQKLSGIRRVVDQITVGKPGSPGVQ